MIDSNTGWYFMHCSAKVVVIANSAVLLGLNPRNEWELPGGWPSKDDASLEQTITRELHEEAGFQLDEDLHLIGADLYSPRPTETVALITYAAVMGSVPKVSTSQEHSQIVFHPLDDLPDNVPQIYVNLIKRARALVGGTDGACA